MLVPRPRCRDDVESVAEAVDSFDGQAGFNAAMTGEFTLDADFSTLAEEDLANGELGSDCGRADRVADRVRIRSRRPRTAADVDRRDRRRAGADALLERRRFPFGTFATNLSSTGMVVARIDDPFRPRCYREERLRRTLAARRDSRRRVKREPGGPLQRHRSRSPCWASPRAEHDHAKSCRWRDRRGLSRWRPHRPSTGAAGRRGPCPCAPHSASGRAAGLEQSPFWSRTVRGATRRPLASLVPATAVLLALALPVLAVRTGEAGGGTLLVWLEAKQGYPALNAEFPGETTDRVEIVIHGEAVLPRFRRERAASGAAGGRGSLRPTRARDQLGGCSHRASWSRSTAIPEPRTRSIGYASSARPTFRRPFRAQASRCSWPATRPSPSMVRQTNTWLPIVLAFVLGRSFAS